MITMNDREFKQLTDLIRCNYGISLSKEKKSLIIGRLHNILSKKGLNNFSEYYNYIISDKSGQAVIELINKITTNHTFFMREINHFNYFNSTVLPYLVSNVKNKDLRIWSAGCSTGEEPYTLAMIIADYLGINKQQWNTNILATDISSDVINYASKGLYSDDQVKPIPEKWKKNYFKKFDDGNSILVDRIKNEVIYRKFNLMENIFPFKKKFHVIFCRNVMIYFNEKTKHNLINKFYECTEQGGYLFIGYSESINHDKTKYKYIMPAIYRKE
ncbi:CheR family methyltransferase [Clostridium uliginosum]|uniref:protein-glutamate O-methyltransferase n=1 Tax=Clostridium uliginosum TaxID=119641 RepID=A0A1I1N1U7_9CLOT|nr:protein-glutamate O-methyltransferase CheR [Clostridium uliginosum]SFC91611.1 chemotaxis protein methyltransferase CheR [Clostridium uliginosum]